MGGSLLTVATYNVNSIKSRVGLVVEWLKRTPVDVLCLQETKVEDRDFPYGPFEALGYRCEVFGQRAYNGVALCARVPLTDVWKGFGDPTWDEQKRIIGAAVEGIHVINVYAPHGDDRGTEKFRYKLEFYRHLVEFLRRRWTPGDPVCLVGDLNVARSDLDVWDPAALRDTIGTMPEERQALETLLEWGFVDAFRHLYPDRRQFTWWDYIGGRIWKDEGMRIDYVLVTPPLLPRLRDVRVDLWPRRRRTPTPSDHAPVIATLDTGPH
jgi:exodeoxyribonuclease-3